MRAAFKFLGVVLAIAASIIGFVGLYAFVYGNDLDRESLDVFGREGLAILGDFPQRIPQPSTVQAFRCIGSDGESRSKPDLGELRNFSQVTGSAIITITVFPSQWLTAKYEGTAVYERGSGYVSADLVREGGHWRVDLLTITIPGSCGGASNNSFKATRKTGQLNTLALTAAPP